MSYKIPIYVTKVFRDRIQTVEEKRIENPSVAAKIFRTIMGELDREHLVVMCLNKQNDFMGLVPVAIGTIDSVPADRGYIAHIITGIRGTAGWIVIHNHLSGDALPSPEDRTLFRAMIKLGQNIERPLVDALIVASGSESFYSHQAASPYDFMTRE